MPKQNFEVTQTTHDKMATKGLHLSGHIIKPLQYEDLMQIYWSLLGK